MVQGMSELVMDMPELVVGMRRVRRPEIKYRYVGIIKFPELSLNWPNIHFLYNERFS